MFSLPTLAPHDSHSLWYSSNTSNQAEAHAQFDHAQNPSNSPNHQQANRRLLNNNRSPLARLRLDEENLERRKQNVKNYGNTWIKPLGISKSLHQLDEERREMEEQHEAMRREALAQEMAELAEAQEANNELPQGEMDEIRDLDDDVPEAENSGLETEEDDDYETEEVPRGVLAARMPEDAYREALVRGEEPRTGGFGDLGEEGLGDEDLSQILQEDDLAQGEDHTPLHGQHQDMSMDMDADLDDDIPEAEEYEHTDTDDELSSSEEEGSENSFPRGQAASSMVRSDGTQNSMDMSSIISPESSHRQSSARRPSRYSGYSAVSRQGQDSSY